MKKIPGMTMKEYALRHLHDNQWQQQSPTEWVFGPVRRGIVRVNLAEIYFDEDKDDSRGGWIWFIHGLEKRGVSASLLDAVAAAETALGIEPL